MIYWTLMKLRPFFRGQQGAALLTAMIIVTLVATLASSMIWQQWRAVQGESAERARTQSAWILSGALDFARLILREDARSGKPTALTEPWATPLAEARLSTFLAVDKSNAEDGPEAFLSGYITDEQARYNIGNLITLGKVDPQELETLKRLCETASVDSSVATLISNGLRDATAGMGTQTAVAPLMPQSLAQLSWFGVDAASIKALQPYVVLLPGIVALNVNTAAPEVLAAVLSTDSGTAERLVQVRQRTPFSDVSSFSAQLASPTPVAAKLDVRSSYFVVTGRLRLVDRVLTERSLLYRLPTGQSNVLQREHVASMESSGT